MRMPGVNFVSLLYFEIKCPLSKRSRHIHYHLWVTLACLIMSMSRAYLVGIPPALAPGKLHGLWPFQMKSNSWKRVGSNCRLKFLEMFLKQVKEWKIMNISRWPTLSIKLTSAQFLTETLHHIISSFDKSDSCGPRPARQKLASYLHGLQLNLNYNVTAPQT